MVGQVMPITQFLDSSKFDPETNRVMGVAFEMALAALQFGDQGNLIRGRSNGILEWNAILLRCWGIPPAPSHLSAITAAPWKIL